MRGSFPKMREEGERVYSLSKKFHIFMGKEPRYPVGKRLGFYTTQPCTEARLRKLLGECCVQTARPV